MQTIGERIHWARSRAKLSQRALAKAIGVDKQSVWKWETQGSIPLADTIPILADALEVSVGFLLTGEPVPAERPAVAS
jgi:transcriptional regulator with XRE-family HTH domain